MSFLRSATALSSFTRRAAHSTIRQSIASRSISSTYPQFAQGYGDGKGDPRGENPSDQGASNKTKENAEHPGPASPAAGQGTGGGPTKAKSPEEASAQSGGSRSKEAKETGSSPTGGEVGNSGGKSSSPDDQSQGDSSPKISDKSSPGGDLSKEKQAEVDQHNKEFEQGHDRASKAEDDKVDKKFWAGEFIPERFGLC